MRRVLINLTAFALGGCASQSALVRNTVPQAEQPYAEAIGQTLSGVCAGMRKDKIKRSSGIYSLGSSADPAPAAAPRPNIFASGFGPGAVNGTCHFSYFLINKQTVFRRVPPDKNAVDVLLVPDKQNGQNIDVKPVWRDMTTPVIPPPPGSQPQPNPRTFTLIQILMQPQVPPFA